MRSNGAVGLATALVSVLVLGTASSGQEPKAKARIAPPRVQAVCDFFGHSDFLALLDGDRIFPAAGPISRLMGGNPRDRREVVKQASP